jgi:hypothetical protein
MFNGDQGMSTTKSMRETCKTEFEKRYPFNASYIDKGSYNTFVSTMCENDTLWRKSRKYGHKLEFMSTALRNYANALKKDPLGTKKNGLFDKLIAYMNELDRDAHETENQRQLEQHDVRGGSRRRRKNRSRRSRRRL